MDLKQLEYFLRVEECGSFSAAATSLQVTQPSLSRQVRLLESEVRHRLFIRNGRGVVSTNAGRLLAEQARTILRQVDTARATLIELNPDIPGQLAIGMPSSLVKIVGVPVFAEFRKRLPAISLSISDAISISLHDWLLEGRLDIALLYKPHPSSDVKSVTVIDEELLLYAPAQVKPNPRPITLAEVARLPLILPRRPHEIRTLTERKMAELGCKPMVALEVDSIPAILQFLALGEQFAILPRYAVSIYSKPNTYFGRRIVEPGLSSKLVLATAAKRGTSAMQYAALKLIVEVCDRSLGPLKAP